MGITSSLEAPKTIFLEVDGHLEKIVFGRQATSADIKDLISQVAKANRLSKVMLRAADGAYITVSPTMPYNTERNPYIVELATTDALDNGTDLPSDSGAIQIIEQLANQLNKVLKTDEIKTELAERVTTLERRLDVEGLKIVEIEKCKKNIDFIKSQIYEAKKTFIDYSRYSAGDRGAKNNKRLREIAPYNKYTLSQETIEYLKQPTFDIWHWEPNEMLSLLEHMYYELGLVKEFRINGVILKKWLLAIQENYRNNPFHNFRHCFCVTQMMYGMIHCCKLHEKVSKEDIGILLTACICHDLDHPGYNNTYQINARTELAIRYNDISPLENHHCAVAFIILSNPETNIFANIDPETFKRVRSGITMLILSTDMARHAEILEAFKQNIEEDGFDIHCKEHLESLKMVLIKCCDISNEVRPMEVSEPWLDCLLEEYFNQSDKEKEEGLPVAAFMDREKVTKPTAQIGFIKFVLLPMFEQVAKLFPSLQPVMVAPLIQAKDHYEELKRNDELVKQSLANKPS